MNREGTIVAVNQISLRGSFSLRALTECLDCGRSFNVQKRGTTGEPNRGPASLTAPALLGSRRLRSPTCDWWTLHADGGLRGQKENGPQL